LQQYYICSVSGKWQKMLGVRVSCDHRLCISLSESTVITKKKRITHFLQPMLLAPVKAPFQG
jgi:hypothetical protein